MWLWEEKTTSSVPFFLAAFLMHWMMFLRSSVPWKLSSWKMHSVGYPRLRKVLWFCFDGVNEESRWMISMWLTACFSESLSIFLRMMSPLLSKKCDDGSKIVGFHLESVSIDEKNVLNASFKLMETNEVHVWRLIGSLVMDMERCLWLCLVKVSFNQWRKWCWRNMF